MKKQPVSILVTVTLMFAAFTFGLLLGKNPRSGDVILSVPNTLQTLPPETTAPLSQPTETTEGITFPIDINTATQDELIALPGIGETLAGRIIAYREANGAFKSAEGLLAVSGIGEKRLEAILDLITTGGTK